MVIAHHLMFTGYGHWLPNDPRGSLSLKTYSPRLAELAETHFGRKNPQPSIAELKAFYSRAEDLLAFPVLWFEEAHRVAIVEAIGDVVKRDRLTCWACAVLPNHFHILIRRHRMRGDEMHGRITSACVEALRSAHLVPDGHPVLSERGCDVFKDDIRSIQVCVEYINSNFEKHRLPRIIYPFVTPYDNWPFKGQVKQ